MTAVTPRGAITSRVERRRIVDDAWRQYVLEGVEPSDIDEEIAHSWRRSRELYRIDPTAPRAGKVLAEPTLKERCRRDEVFRLAGAILRDFSDRLMLCDHALAYFDPDGWMLSLEGDRQVIDRLGTIGFAPGTNWSEEAVGTNGPGTALATRRPMEVFAAEHFVAAWQPWSCAAAPVMSPHGEGPVGLVDITGPWEVRRRQALLVARAVARAVQERVRAATMVRDEVVRYALRTAHGSGDALVAVDARGRVIAMNDLVGRQQVLTGGELPGELRECIAHSLGVGASGDFSVAAPGGETIVASAVRFEDTAVGAILRLGRRCAARRPRPRAGLTSRYDFAQILGASPALLRSVELARTAARNDLPVVLLGESGTGKELFAHAIHAASARHDGPFVAVNCGCIPAELVEAEFFGYEAGTFTGAKREGNAGRFENADGGTLFLDEVSELPLAAQTTLLRVLQEREVVRLGGSTPRAVDVRVVAASNKPLDEEVRAKRFRRDLYYRLNVLPVPIPALRDRGDDLSLLARAFLSAAAEELGRGRLLFAEDALAALRGHRWPGNVRELKNVILRAAATSPEQVIRSGDLLIEPDVAAPPAPVPASASPAAPAVPLPAVGIRHAMHELERGALVTAVEACGWNLAEAARQLGISRMTLYRWMSKHGLSRA